MEKRKQLCERSAQHKVRKLSDTSHLNPSDISHHSNIAQVQERSSRTDTVTVTNDTNVNYPCSSGSSVVASTSICVSMPKAKEKTSSFLCGIKLYIVCAGIGKTRVELFRKQLEKYGGEYIQTFHVRDTTHILVDEKMDIDRMCRIMKIDDSTVLKNICIVKSIWLSSCLKTKICIDTTSYLLTVPITGNSSSSVDLHLTDTCQTDSKTTSKDDCMPSQRSDENAPDSTENNFPNCANDGLQSADQLPKGNWVCARASGEAAVNQNELLTDKLEALAHTYESTNDRWRALGYQKAIVALKKHPTAITSREEARRLNGVGEKLADKIAEILETGELRKLKEVTSREDVQAINLFTQVWGAGPAAALTWAQRGWRTLDDLRQNEASLTRQQRVGLRHYDDLLDRMPRDEAAEIEAKVCAAVVAIDAALVAMACGSFRRGKRDCGDVDVLVTHPDGRSHRGVFRRLLSDLTESGFLTDDLLSQQKDDGQSKYMGVCRLAGNNRKHRRLDIIVVPFAEFACAQLYFTGSAHFNRSMRHLAATKGMTLNEHALCTAVIRAGGERLNRGRQLPTPTERSIFEQLGLAYRSPVERDH